MREVTKVIIKKYELEKLKYDFMGYRFEEIIELSYHHLILPSRFFKNENDDRGYFEWNGSILVRETSHDYLHIIERYDLDMFDAITSEMIDEIIKGYLDYHNLKAIDDVLNCFEREHSGIRTKKGNEIIKDEYTRRLIKN